MAQLRVFLLIALASVSSVSGQDAEVSCVHLESCVLPCGFDPGPDPVINWLKTPGDIPVYSISIDRLQYQDEEYRHRASLLEEVHTGNAALLLRKVRVQDEGRYMCLTSTKYSTQTTYVNLNVYVSTFEAALVMQDSELVCSSEGLYPKPSVAWSLAPPFTEIEGRTRISQREDLLYDVHSSVSHLTKETVYFCVVSTAHSSSGASFINGGKLLRIHEAVLPCFVPKPPVKSLIWKYNHESIIYRRTGSEQVYNQSWIPFVDGITDTNSLVLKNLSTTHEGLYSCHLSTDKQTIVVVMKLEILWFPFIYILLALGILGIVVS